jgi:membrane protein
MNVLGPRAFTAPSGAAVWRHVLVKSVKDFGADDIPTVAAGVTFYSLLAIFPGLSAMVSLYGLFADAGDAHKVITGFAEIVPSGAVSVIGDELTRLTRAPRASLGLAFAISLAVSVYSANAGMKALMGGLAVAYEERRRRGFIALNLVSLAFTFGAVVSAAAVVAIVTSLPTWMKVLSLGVDPSLAQWPVLLAALIAGLSVLYQFGPGRSIWCHWITPGNILASLAWVAMSALFTWYVAHFGRFDRTFGSLGAVAGFMTWIWLSVMVVLFGAELNAAREQALER